MLLAGLAPPGALARRPTTADFAPDRFHFAPLQLEGVGREIPFVYDAVGAATQARNDPRTTYETWIGLGLQLLRERDYNVAADCFRTALARTNAAPDAVRHLLARALLLDDRPAEAQRVWEELCVRSPGDAEARWQNGYGLFLSDDLDDAAQQFRALEALAPAHPYPALMLGLVNWSLGQLPAAERMLIGATRREKCPAEPFLAMAAIACGRNDVPEAVGWLRRGFDRLSAPDQRRWFSHPTYQTLRRSGHPLAGDFVREFRLDVGLPDAGATAGTTKQQFDVNLDNPFGASLDFAPIQQADTNAITDVEGSRILRLAPRLVPK